MAADQLAERTPTPRGRRATVREIIGSGRGASGADSVFRGTTVVLAGAILALLVAIFIVLLLDARMALGRYGLSMIVGRVWNPQGQIFGILPYIFGTVYTSIIGLLIATPIAIGAALFIVEYAPLWMRAPISFIVELLAAIPSIIYGLWGFFVLGPFMRDKIERPILKSTLENVPGLNQLVNGPAIGKDILTAGVILSIMILPTIMSVAREVIATVPSTQREGMLALGATKWEMVKGAVLPYARAGIVGAAMLGLGRALGETMAVTLTIGNSSPKISWSVLTPGYTMASAIANQFNEADSPMHFSAVVTVALSLLVVSGIVNLIARLIVSSFGGDTRAEGI